MGGAAQAVGRARRKLAEATGHEGRRRDHCCRLRVSKWIESRSKPLSSDPRAGRESLGAVAAAGLSWGDVGAPLRASCWEAEMWNNDTLNWEGLLRLRSVAGSSIKCSREACPGELTYRQAGLCGHTLQRPLKLPSWQPKGDSRTKGAKGENRTLTIEWETCPHRPQPGVFRPPRCLMALHHLCPAKGTLQFSYRMETRVQGDRELCCLGCIPGEEAETQSPGAGRGCDCGLRRESVWSSHTPGPPRAFILRMLGRLEWSWVS